MPVALARRAARLEAAARDALPRTLGIASTVIARIADDRRHEPTRCDGYDVEGLVGHLVSGLSWFAAAGVGTWYDLDVGRARPGRPDAERGLDDTAADAVRLAWSAREPFGATYHMPGGPALGSSLAAYMCLEQIGDALDLADAVGGHDAAARAAGRDPARAGTDPRRRGAARPRDVRAPSGRWPDGSASGIERVPGLPRQAPGLTGRTGVVALGLGLLGEQHHLAVRSRRPRRSPCRRWRTGDR
ncbi:MAG: hypothetical protein U5R31_12070 [Acidimicrobiia bacterium]|nr:hypothetical protein [Acidimicrobiia bacterium]